MQQLHGAVFEVALLRRVREKSHQKARGDFTEGLGNVMIGVDWCEEKGGRQHVTSFWESSLNLVGENKPER